MCTWPQFFGIVILTVIVMGVFTIKLYGFFDCTTWKQVALVISGAAVIGTAVIIVRGYFIAPETFFVEEDMKNKIEIVEKNQFYYIKINGLSQPLPVGYPTRSSAMRAAQLILARRIK